MSGGCDCLNCGKYDTLYKCNQCSVARFCSRECQLARLKNHGCKPTKQYIDGVNDMQWTIYYRYRFEQDFNGRTRVLRKDRLVFKFCKTEQEYLETVVFYERHQTDGIVPTLFETIDNAWLIVTHMVNGHTPLSAQRPRSGDMLQFALVRALSKFKTNAFGLDIVANLSNIGYDGNDGIIFYENNGKMYRYDSKSEMIFQFLQLLKFKEPRLLGQVWNEEMIFKMTQSF